MERIRISRHYLSDNSEVFSVHIGSVELHAVSENDAQLLAKKIRTAIETHALNLVTQTEEG